MRSSPVVPCGRVRVVPVMRVAATVPPQPDAANASAGHTGRACRPMATYVLMQGDVPSPGRHGPIPAHPPAAR
ncbi:MAG: hypothetical protein ACKO35_17165 [Planctomycetaceae bacterium]